MVIFACCFLYFYSKWKHNEELRAKISMHFSAMRVKQMQNHLSQYAIFCCPWACQNTISYYKPDSALVVLKQGQSEHVCMYAWASRATIYGGLIVAHVARPPLHDTDGSKGTAMLLQFGTSAVAGVARTRL